jgi:queuosine precursor transporter
LTVKAGERPRCSYPGGYEDGKQYTFCFVGLDLSSRDQLHEHWRGRWLWPRMFTLIAAGSALSLVLGGSGRIAIASCVAFAAASLADSAVYLVLGGSGRLLRINGSNLVGATFDSMLFPLLAFGLPLLWPVVLGQLLAKLVGGALWALLFCLSPTPRFSKKRL